MRARTISLWSAASAAFALASGVAARTLPDRLEIGKNQGGEQCSASILWERVGADGVKTQADQPYGITCRGASAARLKGRATPNAAPGDVAGRVCGAVSNVMLAGIGTARARKCNDAGLGTSGVELRYSYRGHDFAGFAQEDTVGPLDLVMRVLAGAPAPAANALPFDIAALEPAPMASQQASADATFNAESELTRGVFLTHRGDHVEASRLLNDALSRVTADTPPGVAIELQLEAGLADSNVSQFESADAHFRAGERALAAAGTIDRAPFLQSKLATYRALDLLNRRKWADALALLDAAITARDPLKDPVFLGRLNQPGSSELDTAVTLADAEQQQWLVIGAQRNWARSIALLALGKLNESREALDGAVTDVTKLQRGIQPIRIAWLRAGLERQSGRIFGRQAGDGPPVERAARNAAALASMDCAIATLQGALPADSPACLFKTAAFAPGGFGASGTVIAETQLERARLFALKPGVDDAAVLAEYGQAVETLAASDAGAAAPAQLSGYLDRLIAVAAKAPSPKIDEAYFRALQTIGEPAIARDIAGLQAEVATDPAIRALVTDRNAREQDIRAFRAEINALPAGDPGIAALEGQRRAAEDALGAINARLGDDARYGAVDNSPASIEEVRALLKPGEVYLKIAALRTRAYGIAIARDTTILYPIAATPDRLASIANDVRQSAVSHRNAKGALKLNAFLVDKAYLLFAGITGPAQPLLAKAPAVVFDPAGPLRNLPAGILVTNAESAARYKAQTGAARGNYSQVDFLGARASLSTALSPRSFTVVRSKLPPSRAANPFLGFGDTAPAPVVAPALAATGVVRGTGCSISYAAWANQLNTFAPLSDNEIILAARALGLSDAPRITGMDFSDSAVRADSDAGKLAQYQVLHFAAHGVTEERGTIDGCEARNPAALITTMAPPGTGVPSDGMLSFAEVARLKLDANLVVLSACDTFASGSAEAVSLAGFEGSSNTLDGLVRAFITARARAVIATYWPVPAGKVSDDLIAAFYTSGRTAPIGDALRHAQSTVISQPKFSHPYFWGAYFLVGDGSKTMLSGTAVAGR